MFTDEACADATLDAPRRRRESLRRVPPIERVGLASGACKGLGAGAGVGGGGGGGGGGGIGAGLGATGLGLDPPPAHIINYSMLLMIHSTTER